MRDVEPLAPPHGLLILHRVDHGAITSLAGTTKRCSLYLLGNPIAVEPILGSDIRASLSLPVRVTLYDDGGASGAHIAYERPSATLGAAGEALDGQLAAVVSAVTRRRSVSTDTG